MIAVVYHNQLFFQMRRSGRTRFKSLCSYQRYISHDFRHSAKIPLLILFCSVGADVYYWQRWKTTQRTWHPRGATPFPNYAATDIYWHPLWMHRSNLGESIMQESALNTTKTGPIHLPRDGRPVHV